MHDLIEAHNTISFLKEHGISAKKRYGQNFLIDRRVLNRIIEGSNIGKEDTVLEIGPGIGTLTQALCSYAGRVIAVEIDRDMLPILEENLREYDNYEVINEDILKVDLQRLVQGTCRKTYKGSSQSSLLYHHAYNNAAFRVQREYRVYYCDGTEGGCRQNAGRGGQSGLRSAVAGSRILRRVEDIVQGSVKLLYSKA